MVHRQHSLQELLQGLTDTGQASGVMVSGLNLDSRRLHGGELFLACAGTRQHGAAYINQAIEHGVAAIALEPEGLERQAEALESPAVPVVRVSNLHNHVGEIAARFYGNPSERLQVVGVTGTNGKTSVSHFIAEALHEEASSCGLIGTLGAGLFGQLETGEGRTTPDPVTLQARLASMVEAGAQRTVMEVSSHGLDQQRVSAVAFDVAVYTNLSHEHLDYHGDMKSYAAAKRRLFERPELKVAVINRDDAYGRDWLVSLPGHLQVIDYGFEANGDERPTLYADQLELSADGLGFRVSSPWGEGYVKSALLGRFNAANLLAALGALLGVGIGFDEALQRLSRVHTVPGRMERLGGGTLPQVVIDYAHTPDALEHVLGALREHCKGHLWCIFGCGGERDRGKRPKMGAIAETLADYVVVTNDNPRSEEPLDIIEAILSGMRESAQHVYILRDRHEAIARAIALAAADDLVAIVGKGHEAYQELSGQRIPFSDIGEVRAQLERRAHG